jgi:hypothetical protein
MKEKLNDIFNKRNMLKVLKVLMSAVMFLFRFIDDILLVVGFLILYRTTDHINHIAGNYLLGAALFIAGIMMIRRK